MSGWIKVYRSLIENPKRIRSSRLALWLYILLSVNHTSGKAYLCGKEISLKPGQGVFSTPDLAKKLCEPVSVIRRSLEWFESEQQIEQRKTNQGTVITVLNWDKYQESEQPTEQRVNNDRTTSEQRVNNLPIIKEYKECKELKNKEKINKKEKPPKHQYGEYKNVLLSDEELEKLKDEFPADWQERIERCSEYCASKGKAYKDYLATIRNWARNEKKDANNRPIRRNDAQAGYQRTLELLGIGDEINGDSTGQS